MYAEKIYVNGRVYTMEREAEAVEAFAVRDGKIAAVGTTEEIRKIPHEETVDLQGRTVLPGFIDAHLHLLAYGAGLLSVELRGTDSIARVLDLLRQRAGTTPKGEWIRGLNFDQETFAEGRMPTREDLDAVSTEHPILISRYCQHVHVANSLALKLAGITRETAAADELCKVDANGEPNGILWDTAVAPVLRIIPDPIATYEAKKKAAKAVCYDMARYGITGAHTVRGRHVDLDDYLNIYQDLEDEGQLPVRIYASFDEFPNLPMRTGLGNEKVRYGYYKIYVDGSLGGRGAYFTEPYSDAPDTYGAMIHTPEEIDALVKRATTWACRSASTASVTRPSTVWSAPLRRPTPRIPGRTPASASSMCWASTGSSSSAAESSPSCLTSSPSSWPATSTGRRTGWVRTALPTASPGRSSSTRASWSPAAPTARWSPTTPSWASTPP